ncbi:MAG: photosynthetic complex assembly protein PuhC [Pseudomonadota bacterium]
MTRPLRVSDHRQLIPRALLRAMAALALTTTALVAYATYTDRPHEAQMHTAAVLEEGMIQIKARPDGGTSVLDMNGNVLSDTTQKARGFLGVVHNALDFERKKHGITENPPVHLIRFADGQLGLRDDATGWKINLIGFGRDNAQAWADILVQLRG